MPIYQKELLGQSKTELKKEWENLWNRLISLDPIRDYKELVEQNKRFDKCVEAYYAEDCGGHWKVNTASRVKGKHRTYKVKKVS